MAEIIYFSYIMCHIGLQIHCLWSIFMHSLNSLEQHTMWSSLHSASAILNCDKTVLNHTTPPDMCLPPEFSHQDANGF